MEEQQRIHQELRRKLADPKSDSSDDDDGDGAAGSSGHSSDEGEQVGKQASNAKAVAQLRRLLEPGESERESAFRCYYRMWSGARGRTCLHGMLS